MENILEILNRFESVTLEEMDTVRLMNRTDTKFVVRTSELPEILSKMVEFYKILQIGEKRLMSYRSLYFDTINHAMYIAHHNGKLNRYKIRKREYMESKTGFIEVKFKNNKGRTLKKRIPSNYDEHLNTVENSQFISKHTPFDVKNLEPKLENFFHRATIVHKLNEERITIDVDVKYKTFTKTGELSNLSIIEVKQSRDSAGSDMLKLLRARKILPSGMSKYCIGTAMLCENVKINAFKRKLREIHKLQQAKV